MKRSGMRESFALWPSRPGFRFAPSGLQSYELTSRRIGPAVGLRLVDPECVELGELVQEARLRRDADRQLCGRNQDRLAQLPIPRATAELAPLEGGKIEL